MEPLVRSLLCTGNLVRRYMDRQTEGKRPDCGGPHMRILGYLAHHPGEACQKDLEANLGLARSSISAMLGQMEGQGLIRREAVEGDARRKRVVLTEEALALHAWIGGQARQLEAIVCRGFRPEERAQFASYLERALDNLAPAAKGGQAFGSWEDNDD